MSTSNGKPQPGTLIDDLRALSVVLPPNFRARGAEAADLLGALITRAELGHGVVDAAKQGPQHLVDFIHDAIVTDAKDRGVDEPVKGNPVENVHPQAAPVAPGGGVTRQELEQFRASLLGDIRGMLQGQQHPQASAASEPPADADTAHEAQQGEGVPPPVGGAPDPHPDAPADEPPPHDQSDLGL